MTTGNSQGEIREEHARAEAHDRAKQDERLLQEIKEILIRPLKVPYQQDAAEMMVQGAMNQAEEILVKIKRHYEEESEARLELIRRLTAKLEKVQKKLVTTNVYYLREIQKNKEEYEQKRLDRPRIVCLCGSTRFTNEMLVKQWWFTKYGFIVLSWCALPESYFVGEDKAHIGDQEGVKEIVDEVHLRKIDLADEVFVINVNGYIGESTRREINYATKLGKPIKYLEETDG